MDRHDILFNRSFVLSILLLLLHSALAYRDHIPVRYVIKPKQTECLYEHYTEKDVVTFSIFVVEAVNNGKPRASVSFEGPVAGNKDILPRMPPEKNNKETEDDETTESRDRYLTETAHRGKNTTGKIIRSGYLSDWPKIKGPHAPLGVRERRFKVDWSHAGESEDAEQARAAVLEQTHEEIRKYKLENEGNANYDGATGEQNAKPPPLHTIVQRHITPYEETHELSARGWYRLCVSSDSSPLIVEMDIRSADEMRGIDPGTGHVYTHERRQYYDEQRSLFGVDTGHGDAYYKPDGHRKAEDEDYAESKVKLRFLHSLTTEIMNSQNQRMHRMRAHDQDARRGAAKLAWSSKFETLLYVLITGAQVYTVHKWLLGNMLG